MLHMRMRAKLEFKPEMTWRHAGKGKALGQRPPESDIVRGGRGINFGERHVIRDCARWRGGGWWGGGVGGGGGLDVCAGRGSQPANVYTE